MDHRVFFAILLDTRNELLETVVLRQVWSESQLELIRGFTRNALIGDTIGNDREPKTVCDSILLVIMNMATQDLV